MQVYLYLIRWLGMHFSFLFFFLLNLETSFTFSTTCIKNVCCFHVLLYLPSENVNPSLSQHLWAKPQEQSFKTALFFPSKSLSQLWQAKEECKVEALKSLGTSALKDKNPKCLYKMLLQLHLVTGLSWVGELLVAMVCLNCYDSRFVEQLII